MGRCGEILGEMQLVRLIACAWRVRHVHGVCTARVWRARGVRVARDQCGLVRACCTSAAWLISARETSLVASYSDERGLVELNTFGAITAEPNFKFFVLDSAVTAVRWQLHP